MINHQMRDLREEEKDFNEIYQEISSTSTSNTAATATTTTTSVAGSTTSSSTWSRFKDPRIVRVSRAFGGKDRHSKVCTVRGLRDRRVRLSVTTAIQLYDLQERLGLNQPSKVVDWLLNVAKHEIDELPPLRFPDERSGQDVHQNPAFLEFVGSQSSREGLKIRDDLNKTKNITGRNQEERRFGFENQGTSVVSAANNLFSRPNNSLPIFLDSNTYNNQFFRWDPSGLTLCSPSDQARGNLHHISLMPMAGSHQVMVNNQSGLSTHESQYPSSNSAFDLKRPSFNTSPNISTVFDGSNVAQHVRPSHFSVTANLLPSRNNTEHS